MARATAVFIPGLLCTEWLFHGQVDALPVPAVFADTRRHDTINAMAQSALARVPGQLVPIGLSMGGYVALEMARLAPSRVDAMALLSTNCRQDNPVQRDLRGKTIELIRQDGFKGVTRQFLNKCLSQNALVDDNLVNGILAMAADVGSGAFAQQQKAILGRREQHDTLAAFSGPLLIICGTEDTISPPHLSKEMASAAPNADLRLLPNVGHLSALEAPITCRSAMNDLIYRL